MIFAKYKMVDHLLGELQLTCKRASGHKMKIYKPRQLFGDNFEFIENCREKSLKNISASSLEQDVLDITHLFSSDELLHFDSGSYKNQNPVENSVSGPPATMNSLQNINCLTSDQLVSRYSFTAGCIELLKFHYFFQCVS